MDPLPINNLTDRDVLVMLYQQVHGMNSSFEQYKKETKGELQEFEKRLSSIEKYITEQSTKEALKTKESERSELKKRWLIGIAIAVWSAIMGLIIKFL